MLKLNRTGQCSRQCNDLAGNILLCLARSTLLYFHFQHGIDSLKKNENNLHRARFVIQTEWTSCCEVNVSVKNVYWKDYFELRSVEPIATVTIEQKNSFMLDSSTVV